MGVRQSAGLLLFRRTSADPVGVEVLLGHMGGPFWARRDNGGWSIPKGEYEGVEAPLDAALREFTEELGLPPPPGPYAPLGEVRQSSGKMITIWAVEGELDPALVVPGTFALEWPRGSGTMQDFPEIDRAAWFGVEAARQKLVKGQVAFLDRLLATLPSQ